MVLVARKVAGSESERVRPCLQVARLCLPVRAVGGNHGWVRGRLLDWSCCSLFSLAQCILVARGCAGGPGRAQSCWNRIRARASLLASSAHVFASSGSRGKHGGVHGRLVDWSCAFSIVHVYCPSAQWRHVGSWVGSGRPQWWRVCAWVGQVGRKAAAYLLATTRTLAASKDPSSPTAVTTRREIGR